LWGCLSNHSAISGGDGGNDFITRIEASRRRSGAE
jgi:hypothetical protein